MEKCEKARKDVMEHAVLPDVECRELDLSSFKSIRKFVKSIKDGWYTWWRLQKILVFLKNNNNWYAISHGAITA